MHAFPTTRDLPTFEGDAIAQVWLDPWAVRFRFESEVEVYAEQGIEQVEPDGTVWPYDCRAADGPPLILHRLLYKRILGAEREDLRLTLKLEDGSSLAILSAIGPYASGHITTPTGAFQVF